jgi:hypothetical protein
MAEHHNMIPTLSNHRRNSTVETTLHTLNSRVPTHRKATTKATARPPLSTTPTRNNNQALTDRQRKPAIHNKAPTMTEAGTPHTHSNKALTEPQQVNIVLPLPQAHTDNINKHHQL